MACFASGTISRDWIGVSSIDLRYRTAFNPDLTGVHSGQQAALFNPDFHATTSQWANNLDFFIGLYHAGGGKSLDWVGNVGVCDSNPPGSFHAQARAFDLTKVRFSDGTFCDMNWSWRAAQPIGHRRRYIAVLASLRRYFATVLGTWFDADHQNHIHFDNELSNVPPIRESSESDTELIQAACNEFNGANLNVNGDWNLATENAFDDLRWAFGAQCLQIRQNSTDAKVFLAQILKAGLMNTTASGVPDVC
jgi:hypothetical protein